MQTQAIETQKNRIIDWIKPDLFDLAQKCASVWDDIPALDQLLLAHNSRLPAYNLCYVVDRQGIQISANISHGMADLSMRGQDLAKRPFMTENTDNLPVFVSPAYISRATNDPCLTITHKIVNKNKDQLGYLAVDIPLSHLPLQTEQRQKQQDWQQIKGDPSIRSTVFMQSRSESLMDRHLEDVIAIVTNLMVKQGIFHSKLHFSSSRASLWSVENPFDYHIHVLEEIIDPSLCLIYANHPYPAAAKTKAEDVPLIFDQMKKLRQLDETLYLRSASLNIMNDKVSLTFSCDGTHYMTSREFLDRGMKFF